MSQSTLTTSETHPETALWNAPERSMHWLIAGSMAAAAILTSQGDIGHAAFGWTALGVLIAGQFMLGKVYAYSPTLWLITAVLTILNLSGWIAPSGNFHMGITLAALVVAAFYVATVIFESLQYMTRALSHPVHSKHLIAYPRTTRMR